MRSKGYGKQLIEFLMQQVKTTSSTRFVLDVSEENPRAKLLYQRLGFKATGHIISTLKNRHGYVPNFFRMELK